MMASIRRRVLWIGLVLGLSACAIHQPVPTVESACLQQFELLDEQLAAQGLHDAGAYRIPGYPYLRLTRLMASFTNELDSLPKQQAWLRALRAEDQRAREIELRNLGAPAETARQLQDCGRVLLAELQQSQGLAALLARAQVPDDYSVLARTVGLYPLAVPFLRAGISNYHQRIRQDYAQPLSKPPQAQLIRWQPDGQRPPAVSATRQDILGLPVFTETQWQQLFERHAPVWEVEVLGEDDMPGTLATVTGQPAVDSGQATVYTHASFTRFERQLLPQLVYTLWFPRRSAESALDPYAGEFDGLVWRVTLDLNGEPLLYDSIHACGCYHYFFPTMALEQRAVDDFWQEPVLLPQGAVEGGPVVLRVQAGTHYLRRVLTGEQVSEPMTEKRSYALSAYETLLSLSAADGHSRSLFSSRGLLSGSERLERFWLWPSGVVSPGAMRQAGRQAVAFIGRRHFDDPHLFESIFKGLP